MMMPPPGFACIQKPGLKCSVTLDPGHDVVTGNPASPSVTVPAPPERLVPVTHAPALMHALSVDCAQAKFPRLLVEFPYSSKQPVTEIVTDGPAWLPVQLA